MSGLSRTPGKRVYGESRTVGSNPTLSATSLALAQVFSLMERTGPQSGQRAILAFPCVGPIGHAALKLAARQNKWQPPPPFF